MPELVIDPADLAAAVDAALAEDIGRGDQTTQATAGNGRLEINMVARQNLIVAGMPAVAEVLARLAPKAKVDIKTPEGMRVITGTVMARISGPAGGLLTAERTALNMVQFLSGIATATGAFVDAIAGTDTILLDTRKTIPGLRGLSKYAVRVGGGTNHRMRLDDGVLIKDNHIAVAGGVSEAVRCAIDAGLTDIEVECDTIDQVREAINAGADQLLLDNMTPEALRQVVAIAGGQVPLEASGGVKLDTVRVIAETGINYISTGAITQSAPAVDIGWDLVDG
ncbi:MAG: carboxylating nicotinate-nucleotide diphosphorylase [Rhodospirillales bacterium]